MSVFVHLISKVYAYITRFRFKFDKGKKTALAKGCQTWFHSDIKFPLRQGAGIHENANVCKQRERQVKANVRIYFY